MELHHIGKNCIVCNRNDYLPFKCTHCDKIVCIDHRTNHGVECPLNRLSFETNKINDGNSSGSIKQSCDYCKKITLKVELTECKYCNTFNCLYHRHQVQHVCPQLAIGQDNIRKETEEKIKRQKIALDNLKTKISKPEEPKISSQSKIKHFDPKKRNLAKRIQIMKIKQTARGPPNINEEDKLYFEILFKHEPKSPLSDREKDGKRVRVYTTSNYTLGRMIDWCSDELNLKNKNHVLEASQLVFMKERDDNELSILDSQVGFSHYLEKGILEDGDELIMSYT